MSYSERDVYPRISNLGEAGTVSLLKDLFRRIETLEKTVEDMRLEGLEK